MGMSCRSPNTYFQFRSYALGPYFTLIQADWSYFSRSENLVAFSQGPLQVCEGFTITLTALAPAWTSGGPTAHHISGKAAAMLSVWWVLSLEGELGSEWPPAEGYRESTWLPAVSGLSKWPRAWASENASFPPQSYSTFVYSMALYFSSYVAEAEGRCTRRTRRGNYRSPSQRTAVFI